uniref:Lipocalin n=1 Tax=Rhipicephalus zambeziensis TaxID=60191 RepID=A0A224YBM0_9ACAR
MAAMQAVVLCASFLGAIAAGVDNSGCSSTDGGQTGKDGYGLLEIGVAFSLRNLSAGIPIVSGVSCVTTTTTNKSDTQHVVTELIKFKTGNGPWKTLEQEFVFEQEGGKYNIMKPKDNAQNSEQQEEEPKVSRRSDSTDDSGSETGDEDPYIVFPGTYTFNYTAETCAVVIVNLSEEEQTPSVSARDEGDAKTKPKCMLWVKQNANNGGSCCDDYFTKNCGSEDPNYVGSGDTCTAQDSPSSSTK